MDMAITIITQVGCPDVPHFPVKGSHEINVFYSDVPEIGG